MKFASFIIPHIGGTWTVAKNLREGLKLHNIEVRWIGIGPGGLHALNNPAFAHERNFGEVVAQNEENLQVQARLLIEHIMENDYDGVFIDVLGGILQANIARYLPENILRIMIVHSITPGTYAFARAIRDYVHATVAVSPRIQRDLVKFHGFSEDRVMCIPHGLRIDNSYKPLIRTDSATLRLLFLGRIEDTAKGVFWIPKIMKPIKNLDITLTIAGDGPDSNGLKRCLLFLGEKLNWLGKVHPDNVAEIYSNHDVLLMPSRFEGFPLSLVEAMGCGCVPVVSHIQGVTDYIVKAGETGFLFPIGKVRQAAEYIRRIYFHRETLDKMSKSCKEDVRGRFTLEQMSSAYAKLIKELTENRPEIFSPLSIDNWYLPSGLKAGFRTILPTRIKNFLRKWRERAYRW